MNASHLERSARRDGTDTPQPLQILRGHPGRVLAVISILAMAGAGCKVAPSAQKIEDATHAREDIAATEQQIRIRMRALVEPLSGAIIESADRIMAGTTDRAVRREALVWKLEAVPALREALFRPNPFVAIMDTWVLTWQMTDYFESGRGREALGAAAPIAVKTCRELATEVETVAASMVISGDVSAARAFARNWAKEHPIRYSIGSRESTLSRVLERELQETFSTQEFVGNVLVTLDDLTRRLDVYSVQLFDQARWQAELLALDLASDYELEKAMPLARTAVQAATEAVAVLKRLEPAVNDTLAVAKSTPEIVSRERIVVLEYVTQEREATLTELRQMIAAERIAVLEYVTQEREATLTELRQTIAAERKILFADSEQIGLKVVDHALLRVSLLTAAVLASVFVGIVVLLFITRRVFATRRGG